MHSHHLEVARLPELEDARAVDGAPSQWPQQQREVPKGHSEEVRKAACTRTAAGPRFRRGLIGHDAEVAPKLEVQHETAQVQRAAEAGRHGEEKGRVHRVRQLKAQHASESESREQRAAHLPESADGLEDGRGVGEGRLEGHCEQASGRLTG